MARSAAVSPKGLSSAWHIGPHLSRTNLVVIVKAYRFRFDHYIKRGGDKNE